MPKNNACFFLLQNVENARNPFRIKAQQFVADLFMKKIVTFRAVCGLIVAEVIEKAKVVVFEKGEDGYSFCVVKEKNPETDIYLRQNNYDLRQLTYDIDIEDVDSLPRDLYSKEYEKTNIMEGYCDGPQTEAYAILKVYKNRRKVVGVYIDGLKLEEVLEKYKNGEMDLNRYQWHSEFDDWYDDEEDMESVTEHKNRLQTY